MPLTTEDTELLRKIVGEAIAANNDATIKPLSESIAAIQTNQQQLAETLTANSRAEEATKRGGCESSRRDRRERAVR